MDIIMFATLKRQKWKLAYIPLWELESKQRCLLASHRVIHPRSAQIK